MKTLIIIPARYASSRLPGKPLAEIKGKPMIQHVYERVADAFENTYIATDDTRIINAAESFNAKVVMTDINHQSGTDRCRQDLEIIEQTNRQNFDIIINVQGDEPLISPEALRTAEALLEDNTVQIATLIKRINNTEEISDPNIPKVVTDKNNRALYFSRQAIPYHRDSPKTLDLKTHKYYKHIGLYAYRKKVLEEIVKLPISYLEEAEKLEQNRWLENGFSVHCALTEYESISVDTKNDLKKINSMI
jgi:3-deoxy-manno-octulosonate cytidylyltransferase (CMP-KDO synthetase)